MCSVFPFLVVTVSLLVSIHIAMSSLCVGKYLRNLINFHFPYIHAGCKTYFFIISELIQLKKSNNGKGVGYIRPVGGVAEVLKRKRKIWREDEINITL